MADGLTIPAMTPEDFVACIKDSRKSLAGDIKVVEEIIARCPKQSIADVILAKRKLQEARMWLGQSLAPFSDITGFQPTDI